MEEEFLFLFKAKRLLPLIKRAHANLVLCIANNIKGTT
jgi:hypothetical protein